MSILRKPLNIEEAVRKVMAFQRQGSEEFVSFHDCDGRYLARPVYATSNIPSFEKSPYDGYAIRSADTVGASEANKIQLDVLETIGAGETTDQTVGEREAIRIMTGAEIPKGADAIIMLEETEEVVDSIRKCITISRQLKEGENVMEIGSEVTKGQVLVDEGTKITPGVKAVLATFGYAEVAVVQRPVVGVIATGTELLDVDEPLERGKIRNSNGYMVIAQAKQAGAKVIDYGKLADDLDSSYHKMKQVLDEVDILITTGGVSVGDFDLIPEIHKQLDVQLLFNKVAMRPGSVTTVAVKDDKFLFGLSGNPSACFVGFELFTRPIIQSYLRNPRPFLKIARARLAEDFPKANPFHRFVRARYDYESDYIQARLAGLDKSNVVTSLAHATCLIVLPGGTSAYKKGDEVSLLLLDQESGHDKFTLN